MKTRVNPVWVEAYYPTAVGPIPRISTRLRAKDILGGFKARWGINRMHYSIPPGLYTAGSPIPESPVLVTANCKLTFDRLRRHLSGINAWLLVLDTRGINVWCAAGKGTFGTGEVVDKVKTTGLERVVNHRRLVLPQLAAPGVAAHEVTRLTGFKVFYGPVRASDLRVYLENNLNADADMRRVTFSLKERIILTPIEIVKSWRVSFPAFLVVLILNLVRGEKAAGPLLAAMAPFAAAILTGTVAIPVLLPFIPGRSLALKGWLFGAAATLFFTWLARPGLAGTITYLLLLPAITSFLALNFTGATPYTSISGVKKELRIALPMLIVSAASGIILSIIVQG